MPQAPFSLCARGLGAFPGAGKPRLIWTGIDGELPALLMLQQAIEDRLGEIGCKREKRPFRAHLTIGRARRPIDPLNLKRAFAACGRFESETFRVEHVFLLKSDLLPSGAVYSALSTSLMSGE